jgi:hypothetical protein
MVGGEVDGDVYMCGLSVYSYWHVVMISGYREV